MLQFLKKMLCEAASGEDTTLLFAEFCREKRITRLYYDVDLQKKYRRPVKRQYIYDSGQKSGYTLKFDYFYQNYEYVHAYVEFDEGVAEEAVDRGQYALFSDALYLIVIRENMQIMLETAENTDPLTGIFNMPYVQKKYYETVKQIPASELFVIWLNVKNLRYVNEELDPKTGDEVLIKYAQKITALMGEDEAIKSRE